MSCQARRGHAPPRAPCAKDLPVSCHSGAPLLGVLADRGNRGIQRGPHSDLTRGSRGPGRGRRRPSIADLGGIVTWQERRLAEPNPSPGIAMALPTGGDTGRSRASSSSSKSATLWPLPSRDPPRPMQCRGGAIGRRRTGMAVHAGHRGVSAAPARPIALIVVIASIVACRWRQGRYSESLLPACRARRAALSRPSERHRRGRLPRRVPPAVHSDRNGGRRVRSRAARRRRTRPRRARPPDRQQMP